MQRKREPRVKKRKLGAQVQRGPEAITPRTIRH
jgi:hypothetical protein